MQSSHYSLGFCCGGNVFKLNVNSVLALRFLYVLIIPLFSFPFLGG